MKHKYLRSLLAFLILCVAPTVAQNITLTKEFQTMPNVKALDVYRNQFGDWEVLDPDDNFPYAVIRVGLDGTPEEIEQAKNRLSFSLGRLTSIESVFKGARNEILFLVPSRARNIQMSCDGECLPQMMFDSLVTLKSNTVFYGRVHFSLQDDTRDPNELKQYPYTLTVEPANAQVEVMSGWAKQTWPLTDGKASMYLTEGTYYYTISADDYKTAEGSLLVDSLHTDTIITLPARFGWMSIQSDSADLTDLNVRMVYNEEKQVASLPFDNEKYPIGPYALTIKKKKHHAWKQTVIVHPGEHITVSPALQRKVYRYNTFIMAQGAYSFRPAWTTGLMFGQVYGEVTRVCGIGWYLKGRSNFQNLKEPDLKANMSGAIGDISPAYTGNTRFGTWHVNAGVVLNFLNKEKFNFHKNSMLGIYAGLGYGVYMRQWGCYNLKGEESWVLYRPASLKGVSMSAGVMGSIKGLTLSAGINSVKEKYKPAYVELEAGIGWTF